MLKNLVKFRFLLFNHYDVSNDGHDGLNDDWSGVNHDPTLVLSYVYLHSLKVYLRIY